MIRTSLFTLVYIILLLLLVLFSWIASVYGVALPSGDVMPSLLGSDSLRWFVRHSIDTIASAPIVEVLLLLIMIGAMRSCGLTRHLGYLARERKRLPLTHRQQHAARIAWVVFGVILLMVLSGVMLPNGNLLSVTGHIAGGPLSRGWLFLLCIMVCVPCLVYGCIAGLWHTEGEIIDALASEIARCSGYFVTLIVASQLMAALHYVGLFELLGADSLFVWAFTFFIYTMPLFLFLFKKD